MTASNIIEPNVIEHLNTHFSQDELNALLLKLFEKKANKVNAESLWHQYANNRFTRPSTVNQKLLNTFDFLAYSLLPETFESIELSPVTTFGLNRWLTPISQKNILATIRKSEVVSDTASALVPEIIRKIRAEKKQDSKYIHRLCSSHRCLRLQNFAKNPEFTAHFRVFSLASTWHKSNKTGIIEHVFEHLDFYLSLLKKSSAIVSSIRVEISHIPLIESLLDRHKIAKNDIRDKTQDSTFSYIQAYQLDYPESLKACDELLFYFEKDTLIHPFALELASLWTKIIEPLKQKFPNVKFVIDLKRIAGISYYNGPCFKIIAKNAKGSFYPLVDAGQVNWIEKMMQSKNFLLFTSCIGSELFCRFFTPK